MYKVRAWSHTEKIHYQKDKKKRQQYQMNEKRNKTYNEITTHVPVETKSAYTLLQEIHNIKWNNIDNMKIKACANL